MSDVPKLRDLIALGRLESEGDDLTRAVVDSLQKDRERAVDANRSLQQEASVLRDQLKEAERSGLTPSARYVVGQVSAVVMLTVGVAMVVLWYKDTLVRIGRPEPHVDPSVVTAPADPLPSPSPSSGVHFEKTVSYLEAPAAPISFTVVGPPALTVAILNKFGVGPASIDTALGKSISIQYVDGPYTRMPKDAQSDQAKEIARYVWRLPARPKGTDVITVSMHRPMRSMGDTASTSTFYFYPAQLNPR